MTLPIPSAERPDKLLTRNLTSRNRLTGHSHLPIEPCYRLALNLGASATVGGLCHAAERPVR